MKRDFYITPKPSKIMRNLWRAAGADSYILERATYSDQVKYMCLGGIILATGLMAGISGGYAFYTIFEPRGSAIEQQFSPLVAIISMIFGVVWGLMIYNLDRFIVSSTGKGDGTEAITWDELKSALPRIFMGAIIALTISKPVEIRMFKSEIDAALHEEQLVKEKDYEIRTRKNFEDRIKDLDTENNAIEKTISTYIADIRTKDNLYNNEMTKSMGGRMPGEGPVAKTLRQDRDRIEANLNAYKASNSSKIQSIEKRRNELYTELEKSLKENKKVSAGLDGLLERIILAHKIAGFWISLFITLLFMAIELTPIFFKLMLTKTPYDYIEENIKELIKVDEGIIVEYNYHKDKQGQERDLVIFVDKEKTSLEKKALLKTQSDLTEYALAKYKEQMMKKIDANPERYIQAESLTKDDTKV
jgi:hypothetical protein